MMSRLLTALTLLAAVSLTSCDQPVNRVAADGYKFGQSSFVRNHVKVKFVTYKTRTEFISAARKRDIENPGIVAAFTELQPPFDTCTIHIVDPQISYEPEWLGHELAHCLYGQWHTDNNSRS
jgi:hypothetical protein